MESLGDKILWRRAQDWLKKYQPMTIGIAGSVGKTTTKQAIDLALGDDVEIDAPKQSFNQPRSIAKGILGIESMPAGSSWFSLLTSSVASEVERVEPKKLLLEVGANRPGDIDQVVKKVPFHIVVVTNVGMRHLDYFSEKENVAHEIESLVASLPKEGVAILNTDDHLVNEMVGRAQANVVTYGGAAEADVRIIRVDRMTNGGLGGEISVHGRSYELYLPNVVSRHQLSSILAAITVAHLFGVDIAAALERLKKFTPAPGRAALLEDASGMKIIDSSFDATPDSVMSDLGTLRALEGKRRVAIIGDLKGLGRFNVSAHKRIGKFTGEVADIMIGVGENIREASTEAAAAGIDVHQFRTPSEAIKWFGGFLEKGDIVLVTGSKQMKMKQIVARLSTS